MAMRIHYFLFTILIIAFTNNLKSQDNTNANNQEICILINVLNNNYEKINRETFEKISAIGYKTIELGNYMKPFSKELSKIYSDLNFTTLACGGSLFDLQNGIDTMIQRGLALHQKYIICYWPWLDGATNVTVDQCRKSAEIMNGLGEKCKKVGMKFAFHNHDGEFKEINGKLICDYLLEFSDPSLVTLEYDIYYALKANQDPVKYMEKQKGRIDILHLFTIDEKKENPVAGDGMPDFENIIKKSRQTGVKYLVVEGNRLKDPLRYVEGSYNRLQKLVK
jgi:sugar phosphate isomerase/epimerase